VKDFFRFCAATGKGKIVKKITCDSLVAVAEWFFAGFTRVTETQTNEDDRSEVYNVSIFHYLRPTPDLTLTSGFEKPYPRKVKWFMSRGQSTCLPNAMLVACYAPHGQRTTRSLSLSVTGSSFTIFSSRSARPEPGCLHFSPTDSANE
jgi:hypothetical protein